MDDERPRPHGAAESVSKPAGGNGAREPQQLLLWSAAGHDASQKNSPGRGIARTAASKFLLIEPTIAGAHAGSPRDHAIRPDDEIKPPRRDEFAIPEPSAPTQWLQLGVLGAALAVGLCLGWIGGSMSSRFFAAAPAATPVQQADLSGCAREGSCAAGKSDREPMASPTTAKLAGPRARIVDRAREGARGTQQASAANRDVATTSSISALTAERANIAPRLTAVPETRPTTIEGWAIREVVGGTVVLQGPSGVFRATQGDTVPGVGRIDSIVRWGSRWIVATTRGLISTVD